MLPMKCDVEIVGIERGKARIRLGSATTGCEVYVPLEWAHSLWHGYYRDQAGEDAGGGPGEGRHATIVSLREALVKTEDRSPLRRRQGWRIVFRIVSDVYSPRVVCEACKTPVELFRVWLGGQTQPGNSACVTAKALALQWLNDCEADAPESFDVEHFIWRGTCQFPNAGEV